MEKYWLVYTICLISYIAFSHAWIVLKGNMKKGMKIIITLLLMTWLCYWGIHVKGGISFLWAAPLSIAIWVMIVDMFLGLTLHGNPFYLGKSWPDSLIKMPGELYFILKCTAIIVFSGLLYYMG